MIGRSEWVLEPRRAILPNRQQTIRQAQAHLPAYTVEPLSDSLGNCGGQTLSCKFCQFHRQPMRFLPYVDLPLYHIIGTILPSCGPTVNKSPISRGSRPTARNGCLKSLIGLANASIGPALVRGSAGITFRMGLPWQSHHPAGAVHWI